MTMLAGELGVGRERQRVRGAHAEVWLPRP